MARNAVRFRESAEVAGVALSHPARRISAELGVSKQQLATYYLDVAPLMLPSVAARPLTIVRCPHGQMGKCFFQKHFDREVGLVGLGLVDIEEAQGTGRYATVGEVAGLVQLVQLGTLEIHHWLARIGRLECPDQMICDLDPGDGVTWGQLRDAAREIRERLQQHGLTSFVRATGGKGLHVVVPLDPVHAWDDVRAFARGIAEAMQADAPDKFVATANKELRPGKIYIDYLRNVRGATAIANYSTRALRGIPVALPLAWDELPRISGPDHYRLPSIRRRLTHLDRPLWPEFDELRQRLPR